jgi:hypothetical protein
MTTTSRRAAAGADGSGLGEKGDGQDDVEDGPLAGRDPLDQGLPQIVNRLQR